MAIPAAVNPLEVLADAEVLDFREVARFNSGKIGIYRSGPGQSPWELHPDEDEILFVLAGSVTITILTEAEAVDRIVNEGSLLVVPRGYWHRHTISESLVELYVSPEQTRHSMADDPREPV